MRTIIFLTLSLLVSNAYAGNCVFFPERDCINKLKIYIDREGNIYPPSTLYSFQKGVFLNPLTKGEDNTSRLSIYFKDDPVGLTKVCKGLGIAENFSTMQDFLLKSYAERINSEAKIGKTILFLIHGFNSPYGSSLNSYGLLKANLGNRKDIAVVEVYWDGLTKSPISIWAKAQVNSVFVGLTIRKLLTKVDSNASIIYLTHSLGASVATQSLFNVTKWSTKFQKTVDSLANKIPTPPQKRIILSLLAPAIPGVNTFNDLTSIVRNNTVQHIQKIVVGYNSLDQALKKVIGIKKHFGSTSLGCDADDEIKKTGKTIISIAPYISYKPFNLSKKAVPSDHSVKSYIKAAFFNRFWNETFDN